MKRSKKILLYKLSCAVFAAVMMFLPQRGLPYSDIRVLATVLGVDGTAGEVSVAAQLAIPVSQNGDGKASGVALAKGGSLSEALENLEIGIGRRIDYGHLSTVAMGKDMQLVDLKEFVGYLISSGKAGPGTYLVYCPDATAADFIGEAQKMGESSDAEVSDFISFSKSGNHVSTTTALKFLQALNSTSHATFLPCVKLESETAAEGVEEGGGGKQSGGQGSSGGQESSGGGEQGGDSAKKRKLSAADSVAIFGGDKPQAVVLDPMTTKGIVWQDRHSDFGLTELRNVLLDGEEVASVPARMVGKRVKKSACLRGDTHVYGLKIKLKLRLDDSKICSNSLFYDKWKNTLEREFESMVRNNILQTVEASRKENVDFLGIRDCFYKFCRKGYETFDLSSVVVEPEINVVIQT